MENTKSNKGMKIAHYIITAAILGIVIWLFIEELKRKKAAKEVAAQVAPPVVVTA